MKDERLANLVDVLGLCVQRLSESVRTPPEDERDIAGIIKHFEMAFEQSYKCMLEWLLAMGEEDTRRSVKVVFRRAFELGWITDEDTYASMIRDRNAASHTYDAAFAREMVDTIKQSYLPKFLDLQTKLKEELAEELP
jgi:nucleotidyltransferase substrate binding protein (TIGR01987 family)